MSRWTKVVVALVMTLPLGGYVAGTLIANAPQDPGRREPVLLREADVTPSLGSGGAGAYRPQPTPDDSQIRVVKPEPTRIADDDDDDTGTDDERADDDRHEHTYDDTDDDTSESGDDD